MKTLIEALIEAITKSEALQKIQELIHSLITPAPSISLSHGVLYSPSTMLCKDLSTLESIRSDIISLFRETEFSRIQKQLMEAQKQLNELSEARIQKQLNELMEAQKQLNELSEARIQKQLNELMEAQKQLNELSEARIQKQLNELMEANARQSDATRNLINKRQKQDLFMSPARGSKTGYLSSPGCGSKKPLKPLNYKLQQELNTPRKNRTGTEIDLQLTQKRKENQDKRQIKERQIKDRRGKINPDDSPPSYELMVKNIPYIGPKENPLSPTSKLEWGEDADV